MGAENLPINNEDPDSDSSFRINAAVSCENADDANSRGYPNSDRQLSPVENRHSCRFLNSLFLMFFSNDVICADLQN
jgi:hypothetical protein